MNARDRDSFRRIIEHAEAALGYAQSLPDWRQDQKTIDAMVLRVGQIGEHATTRHLSAAGQAAVPGVRWLEVRLMRNRLYHGYQEIDLDILADALENDLPGLIVAIRVALDDEVR